MGGSSFRSLFRTFVAAWLLYCRTLKYYLIARYSFYHLLQRRVGRKDEGAATCAELANYSFKEERAKTQGEKSA